jgi:hypothetical protein
MSQMSPEEEEAVQAELERLQQEAMVRPETAISAQHRSVASVLRAHPLSRQYQMYRMHSPSRCRTCPSRSPPPRKHQPNVSPPPSARPAPSLFFFLRGIPRSVECVSSTRIVRL